MACGFPRLPGQTCGLQAEGARPPVGPDGLRMLGHGIDHRKRGCTASIDGESAPAATPSHCSAPSGADEAAPIPVPLPPPSAL